MTSNAGGRSPGGYTVRRLARLVPALFLLVTVSFALVHLAPGSPVNTLAGEQSSPEYQAFIEHKLGLDRPLPEQYVRYVGLLARGDLGRSISQGRPVIHAIGERLPATLALVVPALLLSAALGLVIGLAAARRAGSVGDRLLTIGALSGQCVPVFVTGLLLILVFSLWLGWLPVGGMRDLRGSSGGWAGAVDTARHLALPVLTLTLPHIAVIARLTRAGIVGEMGEQYIMTARAKGLRPRRVVRRHALRNALAPIVTALGNEAGLLLAGAVITERIFGWPGLGRLTLDAAVARDYPLLLGVVLVVGVVVSVLNLVVDLLYPRIDPRVQLT